MSDVQARRSVLESIVSSRLQVLQSKRLLLASTERRFDKHRLDSLRDRVERLRDELQRAQQAYRVALLKWGSPATAGYWPSAYSQLIELADDLAARLRHATISSTPADRYELAIEAEVIEDLIDQWRRSLRVTMAGAIA